MDLPNRQELNELAQICALTLVTLDGADALLGVQEANKLRTRLIGVRAA